MCAGVGYARWRTLVKGSQKVYSVFAFRKCLYFENKYRTLIQAARINRNAHPFADDASYFCCLPHALELSGFHTLEDVWIVAGDAGGEVVGVTFTSRGRHTTFNSFFACWSAMLSKRYCLYRPILNTLLRLTEQQSELITFL